MEGQFQRKRDTLLDSRYFHPITPLRGQSLLDRYQNTRKLGDNPLHITHYTLYTPHYTLHTTHTHETANLLIDVDVLSHHTKLDVDNLLPHSTKPTYPSISYITLVKFGDLELSDVVGSDII